ncbi:MAG: ABC transporter permease [Thermoleophilia bacterium]
MGLFLLRRIGQALVVLLIVSAVIFALLHFLPGGPARAILGPRATPQAIAEFNHVNGYDLSLPQQYVRWLGKAVQGDLGFSYKRNSPVSTLLKATVPRTLLLVGLGTLIAVLVAIPVGVIQATRRNRAIDHALTTVTFTLYSMPSFWLGLILIEIFAIKLGWLPPDAPTGGPLEMLQNPAGLVLPIATLALVTIASFSRYVRASTVEQLEQDYVRTARAKGLQSGAIVRRHVLRNALSPVVTLLGLSLPWILGGSLVVEAVFNFPGTGFLFWNAAQAQDYPVLLGVVLVVSVGTVIGSLLADLGYAFLDPRVRDQIGAQ